MGYNWHWGILLEKEPGGTGTYLQYLVVGLGWTLATALAAWVIASGASALAANEGLFVHTVAEAVEKTGAEFVDLFRSDRAKKRSKSVPVYDHRAAVPTLLNTGRMPIVRRGSAP